MACGLWLKVGGVQIVVFDACIPCSGEKSASLDPAAARQVNAIAVSHPDQSLQQLRWMSFYLTHPLLGEAIGILKNNTESGCILNTQSQDQQLFHQNQRKLCPLVYVFLTSLFSHWEEKANVERAKWRAWHCSNLTMQQSIINEEWSISLHTHHHYTTTIFINIKIISMEIMPWTLSSSCVSAFSIGYFITSSTHFHSHHHLHHTLTIRHHHTQIISQVQIVTEHRFQCSFILESG